jgi:hypothetical protein
MKILIPSAVCPVTELVEVLPWSLIFRIDELPAKCRGVKLQKKIVDVGMQLSLLPLSPSNSFRYLCQLPEKRYFLTLSLAIIPVIRTLSSASLS